MYWIQLGQDKSIHKSLVHDYESLGSIKVGNTVLSPAIHLKTKTEQIPNTPWLYSIIKHLKTTDKVLKNNYILETSRLANYRQLQKHPTD